MKAKDLAKAKELRERLSAFDRENRPLPGIEKAARRDVFIRQLIESIHRIEFVAVIRTRDLSPRRADPTDEIFDPVRAAIYHSREGALDEAFWCVFLFVHFGKHSKAGYRYAREIYGRLGDGQLWDWASTSADPSAFRRWLEENEAKLRSLPGGFGNHRKYESLSGTSANGTGAVVESYVEWVRPQKDHEQLVAAAMEEAEGDPKLAFDILYRSMNRVVRFGRTARFDYLTMLGKLGLAEIEPGSAYLHGATGPYKGAQALFGRNTTERATKTDVDRWLVELDESLQVGMQVIEDALCNWQKSPASFKAFRG